MSRVKLEMHWQHYSRSDVHMVPSTKPPDWIKWSQPILGSLVRKSQLHPQHSTDHHTAEIKTLPLFCSHTKFDHNHLPLNATPHHTSSGTATSCTHSQNSLLGEANNALVSFIQQKYKQPHTMTCLYYGTFRCEDRCEDSTGIFQSNNAP